MSQPKDDNEEPLEFKWGKPGPRGKNPLVQFYKSFTFDGIDYSLHDCVFLFTDGIENPYIGKIVKIWEHKDKFKKVKVHWFFKPDEIQYYLGDQKVGETEVFFAKGNGVGASNVNPLEAIAGKCDVVCISNDSRNPQPSTEERSKADYVFYRTFDVDSYSISDKWGDRVNDLDVKFIFNQVNEVLDKSGLPHGVIDDSNVDNGHPRVGLSKEPESKFKEEFASSVDVVHKAEKLVKGGEDLENRHAKRMKLELGDNESKETRQVSLEGKAKIGSSKDSLALAKDLPLDSNPMDVLSKKRKFDEDYEVGKAKLIKKSGDDSRSNAPSKSSGNLKSSTIEKSKKLVVTQRPNVEKNTWFKDIPWEDRMLNAQEQGTLILLQNLDPEYTSGEVEDIIWHAFEEKCSAKMVQRTAISSPVCGQALVIIRSREGVDRVLKTLREDCLMLANGRPLVGSLARLPKVSEKQANFVGHLSIDKLKHKIQKDMKEAVSTSHYSQPNTIEHEMAMEWHLLQARSTMWWKKLYKKHVDEIDKLRDTSKSAKKAD